MPRPPLGDQRVVAQKLYFEPPLLDALAKAAKHRRISKSQFMREALVRALQDQQAFNYYVVPDSKYNFTLMLPKTGTVS